MDSPVVKIQQGQLRGCLRTDMDGGKFFAFLGIPYAKPPLGDLRFKAPQPAEPWSGIRDATEEGDICYSNVLLTPVTEGSEDCLNLNIFTKALPQTDKHLKPVMVWIHGGAFIMGSNRTSFYGPEYLLTQDIVLVSINYRLGALGFLSLEDVSLGIPGNAGLKDQTLALKWVQQNIKEFGGDPNNVTIFGESAGSASVHFHILSPSSKGLFHKAILQSGSALNHWAWGKRVAEELANQLGGNVSTEREALEVLKSASVDKLYKAQEEIRGEDIKPSERSYFAPIIEKPNETAFITRNPIDIITSGDYNKVPIIIGYTNMEGLLQEVTKVMAKISGKEVKKEAPNIEDAILWQLNIKKGSEASQLIVKKLEDTYFKGPNLIQNQCLLSTDTSFVAGIIGTVINHAATSDEPIYLYRMSLEAGLNLLKNFIRSQQDLSGACHADDLGYLFKNLMSPEIKPGSVEEISVRRFVNLWTNFAKYGNPTPNEKEFSILWRPVTKGKIHFLDIGRDLTLQVNPEPERIAVWREIYGLSPETAKFL